MDFIDVITNSGVAIGIGLLVGMQREYAKRDDLEDLFGGGRTFALIAFTGALGAMLSEVTEEFLLLTTLGIAVVTFLAIGYAAVVKENQLGITTEIAAIVIFCAGALAGFGELPAAVAAGVLTAILLAIKPYTRQLSASIDTDDPTAYSFPEGTSLAVPQEKKTEKKTEQESKDDKKKDEKAEKVTVWIMDATGSG